MSDVFGWMARASTDAATLVPPDIARMQAKRDDQHNIKAPDAAMERHLQILKMLESGPMTVTAIAHATDTDLPAMRKVCDRLTKNGRAIRVVGRGDVSAVMFLRGQHDAAMQLLEAEERAQTETASLRTYAQHEAAARRVTQRENRIPRSIAEDMRRILAPAGDVGVRWSEIMTAMRHQGLTDSRAEFRIASMANVGLIEKRRKGSAVWYRWVGGEHLIHG